MDISELQALEKRYTKDLREEMKFWMDHGVDHELGGFICGLKHDGTKLATNK
jgi:mannose/cellobiose epimerase-like protein (N-acyl-D-glucosamine 2-epimerase family)